MNDIWIALANIGILIALVPIIVLIAWMAVMMIHFLVEILPDWIDARRR